MPTSLGNIVNIKANRAANQPLLVASIVFKDSIVSPTVLLLSTYDLLAAEGTQPTGITSFPYNDMDFLGLIANQQIAATQALSADGIDITPTVTLDIIDAGKTIWGTYEKAIGFKGAVMSLYYLFWDAGTNNYSIDYRTIFTGLCSPGKASETRISVTATSKINMNQLFLPTIRIQRRCPWIFPDATGLSLTDATALHQAAADDPSSIYYNCGYSKLASGANAVGNAPTGDVAFRSCKLTVDACIQNLGNPGLTYSPYAPIEKDLAGHPTARYGGIQWDPPNYYLSRGYNQPKALKGFNTPNQGKYNDYVPMGWGTFWVDPIILNISGDANFTAMDVLIGHGEYGHIRHVICNDIDVDALALDAATQAKQVALQLFWSDISSGNRIGACNRNAIQNGRGDPYGGLKVINVQVPSQLTTTSSIPRIRVLVDGPLIRVYSNVVTFLTLFTTNPSWIMMDMLVKGGWKYTELDTQSFIDAAAYYDGVISYNGISGFVNVASDGISVTWVKGADFTQLSNGQAIFLNGVSKVIATKTDSTHFTITSGFGGFLNNVTFLAAGANTHARFKMGVGYTQRTSLSEIIRQARIACRSSVTPHPVSGKLRLVPDRSLAEQQPAPVSGSNFNTQISSYNSAGQVAGGYVAWKFGYADILPNGSDGASSLNIDQADLKSSPNKISLGIIDEDNQYQEDSITTVDSQDIARVERPVEGSLQVAGILNFDQGERVLAVYEARNMRGNPRFDSGGTYRPTFKSTFRCQHLSLGDIVLFDYPQYGISSILKDMSNNPIDGFLARVSSITPETNYRTATFVLEYHDDGWYVDTFGQNGVNVRQLGQFRASLNRPAFPWSPFDTQPPVGDALYNHTDWQMGFSQQYDSSASRQPLTIVSINGKLTINVFAGNGLPVPVIGAQGTTAATGGTVKAGRTYYGQLSVYGADGNITPGSDPTQPCIISVPAGADTATLTFPVVQWPVGAATYELFVGILRSKTSSQTSGVITGVHAPASITITAYQEDTWGIPDVECNAIEIRGKRCEHAGVIGAAVVSCTSTTIKLLVYANEPLTVNQFAPSSGNPYYIMLMGLANNDKPLPIANWSIASNTGDTFTIATGIDPTTIDRGDGTFGLQAGDVIVIPPRMTVGSDGTGLYVQDTNWENALNPLLDGHAITGSTNATPIVVTVAEDPGMLTGDKCYIQGVLGNTNTNGAYFVTRLTSLTYSLYTDAGLTTPRSGNAAYTSGGTIQQQDRGLSPGEEKGRELYCIKGTGAGTWYAIKDNTKDKIYITATVWQVTPDATSIFVVNNPNWEVVNGTGSFNNARFDTPATFEIQVPNYLGQIVFFQAFTLDGAGNESFRAQCPWRMGYIFGEVAQGGSGLAAVHITRDGILSVKTDIGPITKPNSNITATKVSAEVKIAPVGADLTIEIFLNTTLWLTLVILDGTTYIQATAGQISGLTTISAGDNVRVDITTIGVSPAGEDLSITIYSN